jgi:DsbC/DsbD-like thiol-disulfide interchange protein
MKARHFVALTVAAGAIAGGAWRLLAERGVVIVTGHAEAELIAASDTVAAGETVRVALRLKAKPGWHTYWRNPGDSGQPTQIEWKLPPGFSASGIRWPVPQRLPIGPLANYGYEGEVLLPVEIRVAPDAKEKVTLGARAKWLVCDPNHCLPEQGDLSLSLPVGPGGPGKWSAKFDAIRLPQPAPGEWKLAARRDGDRVLLDAAGISEASLLFFPYEEGKVQHAAPQPLERTANGVRLAIPVSTQPVGELHRLHGILATGAAAAFEIDVPVER